MSRGLVDNEPRCLAVVEGDLTRQVAQMWRADRMASSVADWNWHGFFIWGHLKEPIYTFDLRAANDLVAEFFWQQWQSSILTYQGVLNRMPGSAKPSALIWMEVASRTCYTGKDIVVWSVNRLLPWATWRWLLSRKLSTSWRMLCNILCRFF